MIHDPARGATPSGDPVSGSSEERDATAAFLDSLPELRTGQTFRFACHPEVPCFNACCGDLNLPLTPYDALRLRRALKLPSDQFLSLYATLSMAPDTGFPMLRLNMAQDRDKPCPFVTPKGCAVYANRPGACRTYPLGRATRLDADGRVVEQFFVVREDHCRGFEETADWGAPQWLADQGLEAYYAFNDRYMRLMALAKERGARLSQKQANMVWLCQYRPDAFTAFITQMGILERLEMSEERKGEVLADEEACLTFGLDWLELTLFGLEERLRRKA